MAVIVMMTVMMCMFSFRISDGAKERTRPFGKDCASSFSSIEFIDTAAIGLDKPEVLQLLSCRR
jgi:hypothetical protein